MATVGVQGKGDAAVGLGVIGDAKNQLVLEKRGGKLELSRVKNAMREVLWQTDVAQDSVVWLRVSSAGQAEASFSYSLDHRQWTAAGAAVSLAGLPPWDQGLRIGLVRSDAAGAAPSFVHFCMQGGTGPYGADAAPIH